MIEQNSPPSGQPPVQVGIKLATALGPVQGKLAIDPGPMRLVELVPLAQQFADMVYAKACRYVQQQGRQLSCEKGCGECCHQLVPLSAPEALLVAQLVATLPAGPQQRVRHQFSRMQQQLEVAGLWTRLRPVDLAERLADADQAGNLAKEYFSLRLDCPFLEQAACGIWPHRPTVCREYGVTSPAQWCAAPDEHVIEHVSGIRGMSRALTSLTAELTNTPPELLVLPRVLDWAEANEALIERTWPGVELVQRFVTHLAPPPDEQG